MDHNQHHMSGKGKPASEHRSCEGNWEGQKRDSSLWAQDHFTSGPSTRQQTDGQWLEFYLAQIWGWSPIDSESPKAGEDAQHPSLPQPRVLGPAHVRR